MFGAGLAVLAGACGVLSPPARAKIPRLGYLSPVPREGRADVVDAFLEGLRDLGYVEGQTIAVEWRFTPAGPDDALYAELAAELVRLPVDPVGPGRASDEVGRVEHRSNQGSPALMTSPGVDRLPDDPGSRISASGVI